jgi:phosphate starvation-inducible PhoH-like protein
LGKRKTSELRKDDAFLAHKKQQTKTFYMSDSKTIPFERPSKYQARSQSVDLVPKTLNQEKYILSLLDQENDIVVVTGPAGTGKTYLAMKAAIKALKSGECKKIVLTRPMVEVEDEKLGFLPGDVNQKMEPWMLPLYDVFHEFYSVEEVQSMIEHKIIEIAPLAFMRGRNLKNCWIILDEAQNTTPNQLKMLLTRISENSKIVITGDIEQTDRRNAQNGLLDLQERVERHAVPGLKLCKFELKDVQRHRIIEHILKMYA